MMFLSKAFLRGSLDVFKTADHQVNVAFGKSHFLRGTRLHKTLNQHGDLLLGEEVHTFKDKDLVQRRIPFNGRYIEALLSMEID